MTSDCREMHTWYLRMWAQHTSGCIAYIKLELILILRFLLCYYALVFVVEKFQVSRSSRSVMTIKSENLNLNIKATLLIKRKSTAPELYSPLNTFDNDLLTRRSRRFCCRGVATPAIVFHYDSWPPLKQLARELVSYKLHHPQLEKCC